LFVAQAVRYGGQVGLGVGNQYVLGLGTVDAVAKTPSTHGFVAVAAAAAVLRGQAVLAGIGGEAGADGAGDDPLAFLVALYVAPELLDDADRFMTDRQAAGHRVLTLEDVYIGAADGGGGDPQQRIIRPDLGNRLVLQFDASGLDEYRCLHHGHDACSLTGECPITLAQVAAEGLTKLKVGAGDLIRRRRKSRNPSTDWEPAGNALDVVDSGLPEDGQHAGMLHARHDGQLGLGVQA